MCNSGGNPTWPNMGSALGFNFSHNIVLLDESGATATGRFPSSQKDVRQTHWSGNTFWSLNHTVTELMRTAAVWPNATTLAQWSSSDHVASGALAPLVADPLFHDLKTFTLQPNSPALQRGFVPFSVSRSGCRGNPFEPKSSGDQ